MSKMIQIRNVPEDLHRSLKANAAAEGMTLSDYCKRELDQLRAKASLMEIDARIAARGPSAISHEWVVKHFRESRGE